MFCIMFGLITPRQDSTRHIVKLVKIPANVRNYTVDRHGWNILIILYCSLWWSVITVRNGMTTSSNGNTFRVTGPLCGEFTGHRWIPLTKVSDAELWYFFDLCLNKRLSKQSRRRWFQTQSRSLWRHRNVSRRVWITRMCQMLKR